MAEPTNDGRQQSAGSGGGDATATFAASSAGSPATVTFAPGEVVAGRFRIVRFIGRGGVGEVYEAEDTELHDRIALKTIRAEIASDPHALSRFRREIQLARRVTHPNVCRTFDIFHHNGDGQADVAFITMELLQGETLSERLRRTGPMTTAEAMPLIAQMTAALDAAHAAGVVHRDLKCSNVMLTPGGDGEGLRAVVTDFGVARSLARRDAFEETGTASLTEGIVGTPEYMAPEQLERGEAGAAADIYALGLIIYEMVTGKRPFSGDSPLAAAIKRLTTPPPSPRVIVPDLERAWEAAILRCLERDPASRFGSAIEITRALRGEAVPRERSHVTSIWIAAALLGLIAVAGGSYLLYSRRETPQRPPPAATPAAAPRRSIAVLGFKNLTGKGGSGWLSTALSEMLTTELAAGEKLRAIPGENVARTRIELALAESESFGKETLQKIRGNLGADLVITGSYVALDAGGGQLRFDLRMQDTAAGDTVAVLARTGSQSKLFDLVAEAGARLRERLGVERLSAAEAGAVRAALPESLEAQKLYSEGLAKLRNFDALAARKLLTKAADVEPGNALIHSALAAAWDALGYNKRAQEEAKRAFDLSGSLPRQDRLWVEGRYRESVTDWDKAVEIYQALWGFFPDNLEYGLRLAAAQTWAGKAKDALGTIEAVRKLPPPARNDPRIDLSQGVAAEALSDFKQQQLAAASAAAAGTTTGARLVVAEARLIEAAAFRRLGDLKRAVAVFDEAKAAFAAAGDQAGVARALTGAAGVLEVQGDRPAADAMLRQSLEIQRRIGDRKSTGSTLSSLAVVRRQMGDAHGAMELYSEALAIRRSIDDKSGLAFTTGAMGNLLRQQGDFDGARKLLTESVAISREIGEKNGLARGLNDLAILHRQQGDLPSARISYEQALGIHRQTGNKRGIATTLNNLGNVVSDQAALTEARKLFEESLAVFQQIGDKGGTALGLNNTAYVIWRQGDTAEAQRRYEKSLQVSREAADKTGVARALINLGDLLRDMGDLSGARKRYDEALDVTRSAELARARAYALYGFGELMLAEGDLARARKIHEESLALRTKSGEKGTAAMSRVALAVLSIEERRPQEAEVLARAAVEEFRSQRALDDEAVAQMVLARALLEQNKASEAQQAATEIMRRLARSEARTLRLMVSVQAARIDAAMGHSSSAMKELQATIAAARRIGLRGLRFEATLALGQIEIAGGDASGRDRLLALEKEASRARHHLIARKAAASARI